MLELWEGTGPFWSEKYILTRDSIVHVYVLWQITNLHRIHRWYCSEDKQEETLQVRKHL